MRLCSVCSVCSFCSLCLCSRCLSPKTKGARVSLCRRTGPKESIPRHPITPFTNTGLLLALFAGLWLGHRVGVTVCVIICIMCSISSTHCDRTPSCSCAFLILVLLFSTDLAPLNRALNPRTADSRRHGPSGIPNQNSRIPILDAPQGSFSRTSEKETCGQSRIGIREF